MYSQNTESRESLYGVKDVPNVTINCWYKNGRVITFYCDVLKDFSFENIDSKIICKMTMALMSNSMWSEIMFNNLNNNFERFEVIAETFKRNASTGQDEMFHLLDHYNFDKMNIGFYLSATGDPANPVITLIKELK